MQVRICEEGAVRPLIFLTRFPDTEIQRYAALAMAGLALGESFVLNAERHTAFMLCLVGGGGK